MLTLDMIGLSEAELEGIVFYHCSQFGAVESVVIMLPADQTEYAAALSGLTKTELDEALIYRGSQSVMVGGGIVKLPAEQIGYSCALVSMSTTEESDKLFVNIGNSKFGPMVVIRLKQEEALKPPSLERSVGSRPQEKEAAQSHARRAALEILLVEDNPADVRMTREALKATGVPHHLHVVEDGLDAVSFLHRTRRFDAVPEPDLILLDLNIPKVNGHEVLCEIKSSDRLKHIPVVVLTGSKAVRDIRMSHQANADRFLTKPVGLDAFAAEMKKIEALYAR